LVNYQQLTAQNFRRAKALTTPRLMPESLHSTCLLAVTHASRQALKIWKGFRRNLILTII
jgi:hypothetical protein